MKDVLLGQIYSTMEHDMDDTTLIGEEGKKRSRREVDESSGKNEVNKLMSRSGRMGDQNHLLWLYTQEN